MTCEEYLSNMKPGYIVDGGSEEHLVMHELSQRALKITMELNNKYHTKEEIIQLMSELTGQKIDESFGMFPPFYTDCGRNIHIGKNVFINAGCKFQDQGGIYIEDGVLIVTLRTFNFYLLTISSGNADLLSAARAGVNMMGFSLLHHTLFFHETATDILGHCQIFLIFSITLLNISGQNSDISIYDQYKA